MTGHVVSTSKFITIFSTTLTRDVINESGHLSNLQCEFAVSSYWI